MWASVSRYASPPSAWSESSLCPPTAGTSHKVRVSLAGPEFHRQNLRCQWNRPAAVSRTDVPATLCSWASVGNPSVNWNISNLKFIFIQTLLKAMHKNIFFLDYL